MKTLEQLKEELAAIQIEIKAIQEKNNERSIQMDIVNTLERIVNEAKYRLLNNHSNSKYPHLYESVKDLVPLEQIENTIKAINTELDNYSSSNNSLNVREYELNATIREIANFSLKSDELLEIRNKVATFSGYYHRQYYNLSNYKKETLFNQPILKGASFVVKIEGTRKADTLIEAGFYESKLYVNLLRMSTKMRTTYILTEESEDVQVEMAIYDSKAETFQKLGTLPSVKKEGFIDLFSKEV